MPYLIESLFYVQKYCWEKLFCVQSFVYYCYYSMALLDRGMVSSEAKLVIGEQFVQDYLAVSNFSSILEIIGNRLIGRYDVTSCGGLPGFCTNII